MHMVAVFIRKTHENCVSDNGLALGGVGIFFKKYITTRIHPKINLRFKQTFSQLKVMSKSSPRNLSIWGVLLGPGSPRNTGFLLHGLTKKNIDALEFGQKQCLTAQCCCFRHSVWQTSPISVRPPTCSVAGLDPAYLHIA